MKHYSKILFLAAAFTGLVSCAVNEVKEFPVEKPANLEEYEYLKDYDVLKNYVDRSANANFKLGAGVNASAFVQHGQEYLMAVSNFDEVVALSEMSHAASVSDKGVHNFDAVTSFVDDAVNAGLSVYGHTLAWHAQQNNKYLEMLIAPREIEVDPNAANNFITYTCGEPAANTWDKQAHYNLPTPMVQGESYILKVDIKSPEGGNIGLWPIWAASDNKDQWGGSADVQYLPEYAMGKTWSTITWEFVANFPHDKLQFVFGKVGGSVSFDNLILVKKGTEDNMIVNGDFAEPSVDGWANNWQGPAFAIESESAQPAVWWTSIITNGDAEGSDVTNYFSTHVGAGQGPCDIVDGAGVDGSRAFVVTSKGAATESWDTQFFLFTERKFKEGDKVKMTFDYRADVANNSESQAHATPGAYIFYDGGAAVNFTTAWQHFEKVITINSSMSPSENMQCWAWNLDVGKADAPANKYYFDNITLEIEESGNYIPQTPEEMKDTLTTAMDKWLKGMMTATAGKVKAWDAVKDVLAEKVESNANFYWQDYLGEDDYVKMVFSKARAYYAAAGGNASDLKLFISEGGLTDSQKLATLLSKIEAWEAAEGVQIDGIAVQLHVACVCDKTVEEQAEPIVAMFTALKESGKLVKISEFDMSAVASAGGSAIASANVTEEQHQKMAELYSYIVSKYLEILPGGYGITQWSTADTAQNPLGLWDVNYGRKHAYAGFADGLGGTPSAE